MCCLLNHVGKSCCQHDNDIWCSRSGQTCFPVQCSPMTRTGERVEESENAYKYTFSHTPQGLFRGKECWKNLEMTVSRHTPETTLSCRLTIHKNFLRVEYPQVPQKVTQWYLKCAQRYLRYKWVWCILQENLPFVARFDEKLPEDFVFLAYYDQVDLSVAEVATFWTFSWFKLKVWQNPANQEIFFKGLLVTRGFAL